MAWQLPLPQVRTPRMKFPWDRIKFVRTAHCHKGFWMIDGDPDCNHYEDKLAAVNAVLKKISQQLFGKKAPSIVIQHKQVRSIATFGHKTFGHKRATQNIYLVLGNHLCPIKPYMHQKGDIGREQCYLTNAGNSAYAHALQHLPRAPKQTPPVNKYKYQSTPEDLDDEAYDPPPKVNIKKAPVFEPPEDIPTAASTRACRLIRI